MEPIELEKSRVENEPYIVWNAFIDLIAEDPDKLSDVQGVAHFAFWYDSEVQNGGHIQYFENMFNRYKDKEDILVSATLEALKIIGVKKQAKILTKASKQYFSRKRKHLSSVEEFIELELEDEFEKFDDSYYDCSPDMNTYLEKYLQTHLMEFVRII
ncbi:DUF4375 domain-containing protein [Chloroflexota bacterium]